MVGFLWAIFIGYLFGCFQSSYIFGKTIMGIDIREHGVNNAGASNAVVVMGWKYGILIGILDILKGFIAVLLAKYLWPDLTITWFAAGAGAFIGHCFPFYMSFKGGKGTASLIGMTFGINPLIGLLCGLTILITALVSDYIFIGTLSLLVMFCFLVIFYDFQLPAIAISFTVATLSMIRHRSNFVRAFRGEETNISKYLQKKP